ncbi:MAG TPA: hypothetical protein VF015_12460, partial [Acidimicrobiales bacterium]
AAAALVAAAVGGALLVDRGDDRPPSAPAELITAVSPGDPAFDAGAAVTVWATGIDDPVAAARAYLDAVGVPTASSVPSPASLTLGETDGATAVVDWALPGGGGSGTVYLRASGPGSADWAVVGSSAPDVAIGDVAYDGEHLSFTIGGTAAADELAVGVWVDGRPLDLGGPAVPQAGAEDVSLGQVVAAVTAVAGEAAGGGSGADAVRTLQLPVEPDDIVTLRVVHAVEGQVLSVTQMAMAMPEADPAAVGLAGGVGATGSAGAGAGAAGDGVSGTADAEGSGGADADAGPVDDVTVPSLPAPSLPGGPTPTLPPLPAPLPAPTAPSLPTTLPDSPDDILP